MSSVRAFVERDGRSAAVTPLQLGARGSPMMHILSSWPMGSAMSISSRNGVARARGHWSRALLVIATSILAGAAASGAAPAADGPGTEPLARDLLQQLIEINSTHPHGSTVAAEALAQRFLAAGFAPADVVLLAPAEHPSKGNLVVRLHGTGKGTPVLYIGHLDVVEAKREDWTFDPFKLTEQDGWLYGRGVIDMKGQDAALAADLIRLKREGFRPARDLIAAFTADEESGGDANGVDWLLKQHRELVNASIVINPDGGEAGM